MRSKHYSIFSQHKVFFSLLFIFLSIIFLIITYSSVQLQKVYKSQAATTTGCKFSWQRPARIYECSGCRCSSREECAIGGIPRGNSKTCRSAENGDFCDDPAAPSDPGQFSVGSIVSLVVDPTSGAAPLNTTFTAFLQASPDLLKGTFTSGKEYEYNFWWNCNADPRVGTFGSSSQLSGVSALEQNAHFSVSTVQLISNLEKQCGVLPPSPPLGTCASNVFGTRCKTTSLQQTVTHVYQTAGYWQEPRVFVNVPGYSVILWNQQGGLQSPPDSKAKVYISCGVAPTPTSQQSDLRQQILERQRIITTPPYFRGR